MDFDSIYSNVAPQFARMARSTTIRDRAIEVDDLVQDGLVLLLNCMNKYERLSDKELRGVVIRSFANLLKDYYKHSQYIDVVDIDEPGNEPCSEEWVQSFMAEVYVRELNALLCEFDRQVLNELVGINTQAALHAHKRSRGTSSCSLQTMDVAAALKVPYWKTMRSVRRIKRTYQQLTGGEP